MGPFTLSLVKFIFITGFDVGAEEELACKILTLSKGIQLPDFKSNSSVAPIIFFKALIN